MLFFKAILLLPLLSALPFTQNSESSENDMPNIQPQQIHDFISRIKYRKKSTGNLNNSPQVSLEPIVNSNDNLLLKLYSDTPMNYEIHLNDLKQQEALEYSSEIFRIKYQKSMSGNSPIYNPVGVIPADVAVNTVLDQQEMEFMFWEVTQVCNPESIYELMATDPILSKMVLDSQNKDFYKFIPDVLEIAVVAYNPSVITSILQYPMLIKPTSHGSLTNGYIFKNMQFNELILDLIKMVIYKKEESFKLILANVPADTFGEILYTSIRKNAVDDSSFIFSSPEIMSKISDSAFEKTLKEILDNPTAHQESILPLGFNYILPRIDDSRWAKIIETLVTKATESINPSFNLIWNPEIMKKVSKEKLFNIIRLLIESPFQHKEAIQWITSRNMNEKLSGSEWGSIIMGWLLKGRYYDVLQVISEKEIMNRIPDVQFVEAILELVNHPQIFSKELIDILSQKHVIDKFSGQQWKNIIVDLVKAKPKSKDSVHKLIKNSDIIKKLSESELKDVVHETLAHDDVSDEIRRSIYTDKILSKITGNVWADLIVQLLQENHHQSASSLFSFNALRETIPESLLDKIINTLVQNVAENTDFVYAMTNFVVGEKISGKHWSLILSALLDITSPEKAIVTLESRIMENPRIMKTISSEDFGNLVEKIIQKPVHSVEFIIAFKSNINIPGSLWTKLLEAYIKTYEPSEEKHTAISSILNDKKIMDKISDTDLRKIIIEIIDNPKSNSIMLDAISLEHIHNRIQGKEWDYILSHSHYDTIDGEFTDGNKLHHLEKGEQHSVDSVDRHRVEYKKIPMLDSKGNTKSFYHPVRLVKSKPLNRNLPNIQNSIKTQKPKTIPKPSLKNSQRMPFARANVRIL